MSACLLRKKQIEKVECAIFIEQTLQAPLLSGHVQAGILKNIFITNISTFSLQLQSPAFLL